MKNELFFNVRINNFDLLHQFGHHPVDSAFGLVQGFDEKIANVRHQVGEAKETVCLSELYKNVETLLMLGLLLVTCVCCEYFWESRPLEPLSLFEILYC